MSDLYLEDIRRPFIHDFEHYLFTVGHLQNNTVMKYLRQAKTVLKMAVEMGWLAADPTSGYRLSFQEKDPMRLEMEELNTLVTKKFPSLGWQKPGIVMFSCAIHASRMKTHSAWEPTRRGYGVFPAGHRLNLHRPVIGPHGAYSPCASHSRQRQTQQLIDVFFVEQCPALGDLR